MNWKLREIIQETDHKFLNFFTYIYDVIDEEGNKKEHRYFVASRRKKEDLYAVSKSSRPDGVLIPCYYINNKEEVEILLTTQFRPAVNTFVTSMPAGLLDEGDTLESAAIREAKEEAGANITDLELLAPMSFSSSGMTDEANAVMLGRIESFTNNELEEFEDITVKLYPLSDIEKMLVDPKYNIPLHIRMILKYLLLRFSK